MGIKDLNQLIEFEYVEKSRFRGHRIGLDFMNFLYISHSKACKEEINSLPIVLLQEGKINKDRILSLTMRYFSEYLLNLLRFQIIPVVIFEGKAFELKNKYAAVRRNKDRQRSRDRLDEIQASTKEGKPIEGEKNIQVYKSLLAQSIGFDRLEYTKKVKEMLDRVGLPWLHCVTEAEHLGTALCREGYTIAFYTTDTDVLALGCPFVISKEGHPDDFDAPVFKTAHMKKQLKRLDCSFDQFQDICILSSCDYNERIKIRNKNTGNEKSVGVKSALTLIKKHGSFSGMRQNEEIIGEEKLEYDECKIIFNVCSVEELCPSFSPKDLILKEPKERGELESDEEWYMTILVKPMLELTVRNYILPKTYLPTLE